MRLPTLSFSDSLLCWYSWPDASLAPKLTLSFTIELPGRSPLAVFSTFCMPCQYSFSLRLVLFPVLSISASKARRALWYSVEFWSSHSFLSKPYMASLLWRLPQIRVLYANSTAKTMLDLSSSSTSSNSLFTSGISEPSCCIQVIKCFTVSGTSSLVSALAIYSSSAR